MLEYCIREDLKLKRPRMMAILDPIKLVIDNYPEGEGEMLTSQLLKDVQKKWDIYHINVNDYANERYGSDRKWRELVGDRMIQAESMESKEIGEIISSLIISSYKKNTGASITANGTSAQHQL